MSHRAEAPPKKEGPAAEGVQQAGRGTAHGGGHARSGASRRSARPVKWRRILLALANGRRLTRLEAEPLGDHVLSATVAYIERRGVRVDFVINFASNCPMDCSYCYLQEYLADNPALKVFSNVGDLIDEAEATLKKHRGVFFRIGTGEITDSLALEPYTGMVRQILPYFADQPNVLLELKTKSDCVGTLLDLDPKGRLVVGWSMNPQRVIDADEKYTASLSERLNAARAVQDAGYRLGFHFDPMVEYPEWERDYHCMVEQIFATARLAHAFLGKFRRSARYGRLPGRRWRSRRRARRPHRPPTSRSTTAALMSRPPPEKSRGRSS